MAVHRSMRTMACAYVINITSKHRPWLGHDVFMVEVAGVFNFSACRVRDKPPGNHAEIFLY
jgi:hypothetical protein